MRNTYINCCEYINIYRHGIIIIQLHNILLHKKQQLYILMSLSFLEVFIPTSLPEENELRTPTFGQVHYKTLRNDEL
jgi:hypothetical protein